MSDRCLMAAYLGALRRMRHGASKQEVAVLAAALKARGYSLSPSDLRKRLA